MHEVAKNIMEKESVSHFDPAVIRAFLAAEERFIAIRDQFRGDERLAA